MGDAVKKGRRVHAKRIHVLRSWHPIPSLHANRWGNDGKSERL